MMSHKLGLAIKYSFKIAAFKVASFEKITGIAGTSEAEALRRLKK